MRGHFWKILPLGLIALALSVACAPTAAPTPSPTTAPAPAATSSKPAEKAAEKPAASPTAAPPSKPTGKPIKAAYLYPGSGPLAATQGFTQRVAVRMALDEINNTGGINGSPLELVIKDSGCDPRQTVTLFRESAEKDQAVIVFGPLCSGEFEQAGPLAAEFKIPIIGTTVSKVGLTAPYRPWAFRMTITDDISPYSIVKAFHKVYPNAKRIAIIGDTKQAVLVPIGKEHFPNALKREGLENLGTVEFTQGMTDMSPVVTRVKEMKPEGILIAAFPDEWAFLAKELARQGVKVPVATALQGATGNIAFTVKDEVEGWVTTSFFHVDLPAPEQKAWAKRYNGLCEADPSIPKPCYVSFEAQTYDAVMYAAKVMREGKVTGDTPFQQARQIISDGFTAMKDYKGIARTYTMNKDGDAIGPDYPVIWEKGKWEL
ncbi:MAG: ABC transporter substrate-binding protein, partial [Chloroflexota bacterium]|nr:ABC transporter substrate-binding protein [Chloroflexota bacterium]